MKKACIECKNDFEFKTHNQKYCSNQCCRIATNKRIMEKYYAKKDRMSGKLVRLCACGSALSMYNPEALCAKCQHKKKRDKTTSAKDTIGNVIAKANKTKSK